jgi:hypothetical protein
MFWAETMATAEARTAAIVKVFILIVVSSVCGKKA